MNSNVTFPLVLALRQMNIVLLLQLFVIIDTVVLIVTAVSLPIVQSKIKRYNMINLLKLNTS